jgi:alginate O-acetyltransferase complex protein AlgI
LLFTEPAFLFFFLPIVLALYYLPMRWHRNAVLLLSSLIFYAWGEPRFVVVLFGSFILNYFMGLWVGRTLSTPHAKKVLALAVALNLAILAFWKYANFFAANLNAALSAAGVHPFHLAQITLPLGISFFTFHAMSYVIDVYRRNAPAQRNPLNIAMYLSLFPQLIAGPIVRYKDIAGQLDERSVTAERFAYGIQRFVLGLGKKMLIANTVAGVADKVFVLPAAQMTTGLAWLGAVCYALQIYFDFSGYSDMAVGLGRMFGFTFIENFNYPYVSRSITEFWRRWHISLSTWFRDYFYIPLGGNRCAPWRVYFNLVTVFALCGLWHGASWTFLIWGLFHGAFLVTERMGFGRALERLWSPLSHAYAMLAVLVGWVLFRSETLGYALGYLRVMAGLAQPSSVRNSVAMYLDTELAVALCAGIVASAPVLPALIGRWKRFSEGLPGAVRPWSETAATSAGMLCLGAIFALCATFMAAGTYNPFIYFRF